MDDFAGIDGFLGTRASLALDLLVVSMLLVVLLLGWSVYQVRYRRRYQLHKRLQIILGIILLAAVIVFEIDIRIHGWEERAAGAPGASASPAVWNALYLHLVFAVSTVILWPIVIARALRNFPSPPVPGPHSAWHLRWARIAAIDMLLTATSGWFFYWLAFLH